MNPTRTPKMVQKNKKKVLSCSTPQHRQESPGRDNDSICDSEAASPVPFLCTQDGTEGVTDVVWNYYSPKSDNTAKTCGKDSTPLSRKPKKSIRHEIIEKPIPKRRPVRAIQNKASVFQELIELNQNLHELINKKDKKRDSTEKESGSEDDIFNDLIDHSPKSVIKSSSRCLRKSILISKFPKPEAETLESDDSMNECLLKASQMVEDNMLDYVPPQQPHNEFSFNIDNSTMDGILNGIQLDSPNVVKAKYHVSGLNNDSFDNLVGNLNDSALERLSQMPVKKTPLETNNTGTNWTVKEISAYDGSPSAKSVLSRHASMPESPSLSDNKPSTSGMVFGRYNSMPHNQQPERNIASGDSPIRCTPEEIKRKRQLAKEKLQAKRLLPFTVPQTAQGADNMSNQSRQEVPKNNQFKLRIPRFTSSNIPVVDNIKPEITDNNKNNNSNKEDIKFIIEKKRQEALLRLRRKQHQN